jgi:hypothetical protein
LLASVLASDAQFAEWTARRQRETELTAHVRKHLPRTIAERVRVTDWHDGVLEIAASAGAIAATLRHRAVDLRSALARDGFDCHEIRVRVQVVGIAGTHDKGAARRWDSRNATPLFELGERLADGPLKAALARWSRRARGR